jgi:hypothetical protein
MALWSAWACNSCGWLRARQFGHAAIRSFANNSDMIWNCDSHGSDVKRGFHCPGVPAKLDGDEVVLALRVHARLRRQIEYGSNFSGFMKSMCPSTKSYRLPANTHSPWPESTWPVTIGLIDRAPDVHRGTAADEGARALCVDERNILRAAS